MNNSLNTAHDYIEIMVSTRSDHRQASQSHRPASKAYGANRPTATGITRAEQGSIANIGITAISRVRKTAKPDRPASATEFALQ